MEANIFASDAAGYVASYANQGQRTLCIEPLGRSTSAIW